MPRNRTSLLDQTVTRLLEELADGTYAKQLPGERALAETLGISRPVVRSALEVLEYQGWIAPPGLSKARVVLKRPERGKPKTKRVGILIPRPIANLPADDVLLVTGLIHYCEDNGWRCKLFPIDQWGPQQLERRLDEILETSPCDIWLGIPLLNTRAFALLHEKGEKLIAVSCSTSKRTYGAIHYDLDSAKSHAFGVMLRAGRRLIVQPVAPTRREEVVERTKRILSEFGINYREDFHLPVFDGSREGLIHLLDSFFAATPRPDGIIIHYTSEVSILLVEGWLMKNRLSFPEDVSVIQIGSDSFTRLMFRPVSHYTTEPEPLLEATYAALDRFFSTGECLSGSQKLETTYIKGESV